MKEKRLAIALTVVACQLMVIGMPALAEVEKGTEDVLVVRYACLVGGREAGTAPTAAGVLSREELSDFLLEWEPDADNREVREVFALNELGELARQASQLPADGMVVSGVYAHGDSTFEIDMNIRPARTLEEGDELMTVAAEIKRNGELLAGPLIHTRLGERAIITTTNGPEAPFLFLVVEIDRVSSEDLFRRGLRHSWRKDYMLVDGEDVTSPKALVKTQPGYPEEARKLKHQGRVVLRMVIDETGEIEDVEIVEGQPYGLSEAAVAAAKTWKFSPALHKGKPVAVFYVVTVNFKLE
ncbi:MAG: energy transducer TonB [Acidobacteriota bacterium]|nr:energy transducer TonB [Acidobacteriota bacterium]